VVVPPPGAVEGEGVPIVGCANAGVVANIDKLMAIAKTTVANIVGCVTFIFILTRVLSKLRLYKILL
jgi:hypothetical protein